MLWIAIDSLLSDAIGIIFLNIVYCHIVLLILVEIVHSIVELGSVLWSLVASTGSHATTHRSTASLVHIIAAIQLLLSVIIVVIWSTVHIISNITLRHVVSSCWHLTHLLLWLIVCHVVHTWLSSLTVRQNHAVISHLLGHCSMRQMGVRLSIHAAASLTLIHSLVHA